MAGVPIPPQHGSPRKPGTPVLLGSPHPSTRLAGLCNGVRWGVPALPSSGTTMFTSVQRAGTSPLLHELASSHWIQTRQADVQPLSRALWPASVPAVHPPSRGIALVLCAEIKHPASGFGLPPPLESLGRPSVGSYAQSPRSPTVWLSISWGEKKLCGCHPLDADAAGALMAAQSRPGQPPEPF